MLYNFNDYTSYMTFLNFLKQTCDNFKLVYEDEIDDEFLSKLSSNLVGTNWTRKFPGYGKQGGMKIMHYKFDERVILEFQKYGNIFEVGYNNEGEIGIDFAFYKGNTLICYVINHEDMCYIEEPFERYFDND